MNSIKIKKGDTVEIISGKDKGKSGKVVRVIPSANRIAIEGINVYKKHVRPRTAEEKGQVVEVARPLNASNVMVVCPSCKKSARIGRVREGDKTLRVCKSCKKTFE
jgi:large subunit ribosomal protein L24